MINKSNFKKVLKDRGRIYFDGETICNGYFLLKVDPEAKEEIVKTFGTESNFIIENKQLRKDNLAFPNFENIIESARDEQEFKFTGFSKKTLETSAKKEEVYIFMGLKDGTLMYIDKKFIDMFDDIEQIQFRGSTASNGLRAEIKNIGVVGLIMPIRPNDIINGYKIIKED